MHHFYVRAGHTKANLPKEFFSPRRMSQFKWEFNGFPKKDDPVEELKAPPPSSSVQFLGGRRVHSVENICGDSKPARHVSADPNTSRDQRLSQQSDNLKRSTSMQGKNPSKGKKNYQC